MNENNLKRSQGWPIFKQQLLIVRWNILGSLLFMMMMIMKQILSQRPFVVKSHSVPRLTPPANTFYVFLSTKPTCTCIHIFVRQKFISNKKVKKIFLARENYFNFERTKSISKCFERSRAPTDDQIKASTQFLWKIFFLLLTSSILGRGASCRRLQHCVSRISFVACETFSRSHCLIVVVVVVVVVVACPDSQVVKQLAALSRANRSSPCLFALTSRRNLVSFKKKLLYKTLNTF